MDSASLDIAALVNVTNAMVALVNENTKLKEINAMLSGRLRELEHEEQGQGVQETLDAPDAHEGHEG